MLKSYNKFIEELTQESLELIDEGLKDYAGSEGKLKRMYEIYEEGWELSNKDKEAEGYYNNINQYINDYFNR